MTKYRVTKESDKINYTLDECVCILRKQHKLDISHKVSIDSYLNNVAQIIYIPYSWLP